MIRDKIANKMVNKGFVVFVLAVQLFISAGKVSFAEEFEGLSGKYKGCNVILIILDALRPDHLSCYGYDKETSPNIDKLAKEGVLFSNAFSQASYTLPSVTSIFTSVYPYSHGVMHILKDKVPEKLDTLAGVLSSYGYNTAWFGLIDDFHTGSAPGLLRGFKEKYDLSMKKKDIKIINWVRKFQKEPFFVSVHFYSTHERFFPFIRFDNEFSRGIPKDFIEQIDALDKDAWDDLQNKLKNDPEPTLRIFGKDLVGKFLTQSYSPRAFDKLFDLLHTDEQKVFMERIFDLRRSSFILTLNKERVASFISLLDSALYGVDKDMIGPLIQELRELNLYDKTIIIITADHGNEYLEHADIGHGKTLYDESIHIPLIYYLPHLNKAVTAKELAQGIDILPTILDLLGIGIPHQAQGISLVGLIEGKKKALRNKYVFSEGVPAGNLAIRTKDWKFIEKPIEGKVGKDSLDFKLYHITKDPHELQNVYKDNPKVARLLKSRLDAWKKGLVIYRATETEFTAGVDEETKERIKNTGYW